MRYIDLRSDTVTVPTTKMREAMATAEVGDDVYQDDYTTIELENYAAKLTGKQAALFVPSGTFGNQLALFTHCKRGDEVILGENSHIVAHEAGASAVIAGVQLRTISDDFSGLRADDVGPRIRIGHDIHCPETSLICLENALANGRVVSLEQMQEVYLLAKQHNIPVHLDGARIFNAATYLNVSASDIAQYCDSLMFCLSKGLCAPFGSILAGSKDFIDNARKKRKLMGGGLRQTGILAAAGIIALEDMPQQLIEDHKNAIALGHKLSTINGIDINLADIHINMVFFSIDDSVLNGRDIAAELFKFGIKVNGPENGQMRLVTNHWITREDIFYVADCIRSILQ